MKKLIFVLLASVSAVPAVPAPVFAQDIFWNDFEKDKNVFPEEEPSPAVEKKAPQVETFSKNLAGFATYWNMSPLDIQALRNRGLGFDELIKTVLISKDANKPVEEIVKRRNRGETFKKICGRYGLNYADVSSRAQKISSEVKIYGTK